MPPTPEMEKCKFGTAPKGVCLNAKDGCRESRSALDTTGYCRSCKIKLGIPVAPSRKHEDTAVAVTKAPPGQVLVDAGFVTLLWGTLTTAQRGVALETAWPRLPIEMRVQILTAYLGTRTATSEV